MTTTMAEEMMMTMTKEMMMTITHPLTRTHLQDLPPRIHSCAASDIIALKKKITIFDLKSFRAIKRILASHPQFDG